ncbi:MAG: bifunctional UDP-N-acetylmuramoyl-tripeptide:D-alanyl-D-alanine ligase/alanine racemase [Luteibaculaceae bacterium]
MLICPQDIKTIAEHCHGEIEGKKETLAIIANILLDSRVQHFLPETLFIALKTQKNNGHHYIESLYTSGLRFFLVNTDFNTDPFPEATFIKVENTLNALQLWASNHRAQYNIPIVAVTGSNGKTIVKELFAQLTEKKVLLCKSPKSFNSQIGVPLSVLQLNASHTLGIFEAGISQPKEMEKLEAILKPTHGVFTNVLTAHLENFENQQALAQEKAILFNHCKTVICSHNTAKMLGYPPNYVPLVNQEKLPSTVGRFYGISRENNGTGFHIEHNSGAYNVQLPFTDSVYQENALTAIALCIELNLTSSLAQVSQLKKIAMRLELIKGQGSNLILNDAYSNDISSIKVALDYQDSQKLPYKNSVIISDIPEPGKNPEATYQNLVELLNSKKLYRIITVGVQLEKYSHAFKAEEYQHFPTSEKLMQWLQKEPLQREFILIKGGRSFRFEQVVKVLQAQGHETVLEINLSAMEHNLNCFKSIITPKTGIIAMVKAFGYGSGAAEVADMLSYNQIDYLAVAYVDEGISLRKAGITTPIMVMHPHVNDTKSLLKYTLEPVVYSETLFEALTEELTENVVLTIHLKLETGLNRLGFTGMELDRLLPLLTQKSNVKVKSCFSHLAASGNPNEDAYSKKQAETLLELHQKLEENLNYSVKKHIVNSDGILRFPAYHFDYVRLGIGLHGLSSNAEMQSKLEIVATLKSKITQIKTLQKGETCGYDRKYVAPENNTKIAIIPIGYADGIPRLLGNGNYTFLINGKLAHTVGNICMDMCMVNVTEITCKSGDECIIFGENKNIKELAKAAQTIPYEILTNISNRVKRIYFRA